MTFNRKGRRKMQYYLKSKEEALAEVQAICKACEFDKLVDYQGL